MECAGDCRVLFRRTRLIIRNCVWFYFFQKLRTILRFSTTVYIFLPNHRSVPSVESECSAVNTRHHRSQRCFVLPSTSIYMLGSPSSALLLPMVASSSDLWSSGLILGYIPGFSYILDASPGCRATVFVPTLGAITRIVCRRMGFLFFTRERPTLPGNTAGDHTAACSLAVRSLETLLSVKEGW